MVEQKTAMQMAEGLFKEGKMPFEKALWERAYFKDYDFVLILGKPEETEEFDKLINKLQEDPTKKVLVFSDNVPAGGSLVPDGDFVATVRHVMTGFKTALIFSGGVAAAELIGDLYSLAKSQLINWFKSKFGKEQGEGYSFSVVVKVHDYSALVFLFDKDIGTENFEHAWLAISSALKEYTFEEKVYKIFLFDKEKKRWFRIN